MGAVHALVPRLTLRLLGVESAGRGVGLMSRLFASRDIALGIALMRAAGQPAGENRALIELLAVSQLLDLIFTLGLAASGQASRRAALSVLLSAPPTGLLALSLLDA
ncbi:MAG: hypothetical protein NVSMB29_01430 [Candidatus Dormibacteria bacterium]